MKRFLYKILFLLLAVSSVFWILDKLAVNGLSKLQDDDYKDLGLLYNSEIDDELLIIGSSRAWNHFDIQEIEEISEIKSRVIGLSGADYNMQRALWEQALNSQKNIKYIVHVVGALEFSSRKDGVFSKYKFFPHLKNKYVSLNLSRIQKDLWKDQYVPLYKFHGSYKYLLKGLTSNFKQNTPSSYDKFKGFRGFEGDWDGKININTRVISDDDRNKALSFIREEAKLAKAKQIKLFIVYAPEYFGANDVIKGKDKVLRDLNIVAKEFDNLHFLNYADWEENSKMKIFHNATHLNTKGAKLFSNKFAKDFLNIIKSQSK